MNSGHTSGNFAAPYNLETHHYQQRTRKCSTGCFADCIGLTGELFFEQVRDNDISISSK